MDEEELFGRLANSAPLVAPRDDRLGIAIDQVVMESRPVRRQRKRLFVAGATLSVMLVGGTSAALASQPLLDWLGFAPDQSIQHVNANGDYCAAGMIVRPEGVPNDDASFLAAKDIFLGIDFNTLKIPDAIRNDYKYSAAAASAKAEEIAEYNAAHPEATLQPALPDPETDMLIDTAYTLMTDGLKARGLDVGHFSLEGAGTCDEVSR